MYTALWKKYMPVIRLMIKKAGTSPQVLQLNRTDFDKAGGGKKAGFRFVIDFNNGKVFNRSGSAIAKDLVTAVQQDTATMELLSNRGFELELNPKCELFVRCTDPVTPATGEA